MEREWGFAYIVEVRSGRTVRGHGEKGEKVDSTPTFSGEMIRSRFIRQIRRARKTSIFWPQDAAGRLSGPTAADRSH